MIAPRVLAIRHVPWEGPGLIASQLATRGIDLDIRESSTPASGLEGYSGLVVLGGPMRASDPALASEIDLLRRAVARGMPVLGVCLGHQLLSLALGGTLLPDASPEVGVGPITLTADSALGRSGEAIEVLHWHGDAVTLPPRSRPWARSARCANQAFRVGSALGLQFHLEVDAELLREWIAVPEVAAEVRGSVADLEARFAVAAPALGALAASVFGDFASRVIAREHAPIASVSNDRVRPVPS